MVSVITGFREGSPVFACGVQNKANKDEGRSRKVEVGFAGLLLV